MENRVSRVLIETIVRNALADIQSDPERSIRNLIDMALQTAKGRFQQHFFGIAQRMLENQNSAYYDLIRNAAANIRHEHLLTFGMNLGYNSCTLGAQKIREAEAALRFFIPWILSLELEAAPSDRQLARCRALIGQGESMGIRAWIIVARGRIHDLVSLAGEHPDSAFFLLCEPFALTREAQERASETLNAMPVVRFTEEASRVCRDLRERRLLYSVYARYGEGDLPLVCSGDWLDRAEQAQPVFACLCPAAGCAEGAIRAAGEYAQKMLDAQLYQTLPVELTRTCGLINQIVSGRFDNMGFDSDGQLCTLRGRARAPRQNYFQSDLQSILIGAEAGAD